MAVANTIPQRVAPSAAGISPHPRVVGIAASTRATPVTPSRIRLAHQSTMPLTTSRGATGVAVIASKARRHLKPSITG